MGITIKTDLEFPILKSKNNIFDFNNAFSYIRCQKVKYNNGYYYNKKFDDRTKELICKKLIEQLTYEYSYLFNDNRIILDCFLSSEKIITYLKNGVREYKGVISPNNNVEINYIDLFDAICCQIQEDVIVFETDLNGNIICIASHLSPQLTSNESKIMLGDSIEEITQGAFDIKKINSKYVNHRWSIVTLLDDFKKEKSLIENINLWTIRLQCDRMVALRVENKVLLLTHPYLFKFSEMRNNLESKNNFLDHIDKFESRYDQKLINAIVRYL